MPDQRISDDPKVSSVDLTDELPIVRGGANYRADIGQVKGAVDTGLDQAAVDARAAAAVSTGVESWARIGQAGAIPAGKLVNAPGASALDQAAVDGRVTAGVESWARVGQPGAIPAGKLVNAPADAGKADTDLQNVSGLTPQQQSAVRTAIDAAPSAPAASQAEAEAGASPDVRGWSPLRVRQAADAAAAGEVEPWARTGRADAIPAGKLGNAPATDITGKADTDLQNVAALNPAQQAAVRTAIGAQTDLVDASQAEAEAGAETDARRWAPQQVAQAAVARIGAEVAPWARAGDATDIPDDKLTLAGGLTQEQVHERINREVYPWAQEGEDGPIPAYKLVNAPQGGGATSENKIGARGALPPVSGFTAGDMISADGLLYVLLEAGTNPSTVTGRAAATSGDHVGGAVIDWLPTQAGDRVRLLLPRSELGATPPATVGFRIYASGGVDVSDIASRQASRDTADRWAYTTGPSGDRVPAAVGGLYAADFFRGGLVVPLPVHTTSRWEIAGRGPAEIAARIRADVADWAEEGNPASIPLNKLGNAPGLDQARTDARADARIAEGVHSFARIGNEDLRHESGIVGDTAVTVNARHTAVPIPAAATPAAAAGRLITLTVDSVSFRATAADLLALAAIAPGVQLSSANAIRWTSGADEFLLAHGTDGGLHFSAGAPAAYTVSIDLTDIDTEDYARRSSSAAVPASRLPVASGSRSGIITSTEYARIYAALDVSHLDMVPIVTSSMLEDDDELLIFDRSAMPNALRELPVSEADKRWRRKSRFSADAAARLLDIEHAVTDAGGWADGGGQTGNAFFSAAPTLVQAQAATYAASWTAAAAADRYAAVRVALADEGLIAGGDLRLVISTDDDPRAVIQRSDTWTRLGADASYAYFASSGFAAVAGSVHVERYAPVRWRGDIRADLTPAPVLDADLPVALPRPAGSAVSPPSARAVTALVDDALIDGAPAWGPPISFTRAPTLAGVTEGSYYRITAREIAFLPAAADRPALSAAAALRLGDHSRAAAVLAQGAPAVIRHIAVRTGEGTAVTAFSQPSAGTVRLAAAALPGNGSVIELSGASGNSSVRYVVKAVSAGAGWFEIWETAAISGSAARWHPVELTDAEPGTARVVTGTAGGQPSQYGFALTLASAIPGLAVGDVIRLSGQFVIGTTPGRAFVVRAIAGAVVTIATTEGLTSWGGAGHATRLSIHVDTDLPADLGATLNIRRPDTLRSARGIAVGRHPADARAWGRFANETAALAGTGSATWTNSGRGTAPAGAYWNIADVPAGASNLWLLEAQARPAAGSTTDWTFGAWGAVQIENAPQPNVQFSADVSPRVWHNTYSQGRVIMRDWNPLASQWGGERPVAQADAVGDWVRIGSGSINWVNRWQGGSFSLISEQDMRTWRDCKVHVAIYSTTGTHLRRGTAYIPTYPNMIAAPNAQHDGSAPLYQLASSVAVLVDSSGAKAIMEDSIRGQLCFKFIRSQVGSGLWITNQIRVYEAESGVRLYFSIYVR